MERQLVLININNLLLHENFEVNRTKEVFQSLKNDRVLRNPIIVTKLESNQDYLVLDGVHRYLALKKLGIKNIPCQVVDNSEFTLNSWCHLVDKGCWLEVINKKMIPTSKCHQNPGNKVVKIWGSSVAEKQLILIEKKQTNIIFDIVNSWNDITNSYINKYQVKRIESPINILSGANKVIVEYPTLTLQEIITIVSNGYLLPAGVTRFIIKNKFENLDIQLSELGVCETIEI
jgi:hypothetical protein